MKNIILKNFLPVALAGLWIIISEFIRNEFLLKNSWTAHYSSLGLKFVTLPINGIIWIVWSFVFAYLIYKLLQKFSFKETLVLSWLGGFVLMWITTYNLQVLPMGILLFAIPLSLLEVFVAEIIINKITK